MQQEAFSFWNRGVPKGTTWFVLGRQRWQRKLELLRIVEERLASRHQSTDHLGLQRSAIDDTVIPLRTLQHRRSRREKLTIEESDRVLRVIRAVSLAESV